MKTLCLMIDRLHIGYVGAYGNSWIETPSLDRLAGESFLLDRYWIDSPRLDVLYRSLWQGRHALEPPCPPAPETALPSLLSGAGVETVLVSDEPAVLDHPLAQGFGERIVLPSMDTVELVDQWEGSYLARSFAQLLQRLNEIVDRALVWCHLKGLGAAWDAPYEFRSRYAAEEDPDPPRSATVPRLVLAEDYDPDELLGVTLSYAGQVTLLDHCLGGLLEWLSTSGHGHDTMLLLAATRGLPLGEHRRVGDCSDAIYGELAHVPVLIRLPNADGAAARTQALAGPTDLWATLCDWWRTAEQPSSLAVAGHSLLPLARNELQELRDRLCIAGRGDERGIVTPAWFARFAETRELYVKPDDRWELNDVADRCVDVLEALEGALRACEQCLSGAERQELPALEDMLVQGHE